MHDFDFTLAPVPALDDWWGLQRRELEQLALKLLDPLPGGWVRCGENFIRVGNVKYGAKASKIEAELEALVSETGKILSGGNPESCLRAAAFYHLRFENIHPLCEANGRIGRVILAGQLQQAIRVPFATTLTGLKDWEIDYKRLFATNNSALMFELLLDLLSRITGIILSPEANRLPASVEPLYPEKKVPENVSRLHPEKALANPEMLKKFAQQNQLRRKG